MHLPSPARGTPVCLIARSRLAAIASQSYLSASGFYDSAHNSLFKQSMSCSLRMHLPLGADAIPVWLYVCCRFVTFALRTYLSASGFIVGNRSTSLIAAESVRSIHIRSMPKPIPPVGGIPISRAFIKSSSVVLASSSPIARSSS